MLLDDWFNVCAKSHYRYLENRFKCCVTRIGKLVVSLFLFSIIAVVKQIKLLYVLIIAIGKWKYLAGAHAD